MRIWADISEAWLIRPLTEKAQKPVYWHVRDIVAGIENVPVMMRGLYPAGIKLDWLTTELWSFVDSGRR